SFVGCDVTGEQNFNYEPGDSLLINGPQVIVFPQDLTTPDTTDVVDTVMTATYSPSAYTINKTYEWSVEGAAQADSVYRSGLYYDVSFDQAGTTSTINLQDGEYAGS